MAQLKDSVVQGSLRVTDTTYTNDLIVGDTSAPTIAADYLMIVDTSDGNKIVRGPLLDGSTETSILTKKGTWVSVEGTNPINVSTSSGKITVSLSSSYNPFSGSQTKNTVFAAPSTANGAPTFRTLVAADMPVATTAAKGAVIVGDTLSVSNEILNVKYGTAASTSLQGNQNLFKLNNSAKNAAANASFYAPTTSGTTGYVLGSAGGTNAPVWSNKGNGRIFYGTCGTVAGTAAKVVVCEQYDELQIGDIMIVTFTNTNTTNTALTMSITNAATNPTVTTTAKDIKCQIAASVSNIPAVGYLVAARPYMFVYDGTYWMMMNVNRDNDNNTTAYQIRYSQNVFTLDNTTGGTGRTLNRYKILLQKPNGQLTPVTTKGNSTATTDETIYDGEFLIQGEILYYSNTSTLSPGATIGASYLWKQVDLNLAQSFNTGSTLIVGKEVYLKALPTYMDSPYAKLYKNNNWPNMAINANTGIGAGCITQNIYDEHRNYIYIKLGIAYSTSNITLSEDHPIYYGASADSRIPYGPLSGSMYSSIFTGQASLSDFKTWIVSIAKSKSSGTITPIGFYLNITNANSWESTNLVTDGRSSSIRFAGFLHTEKYTNSSNQLVEVSGDLFFWEVIDILNPNANIVRQTYLWQFDCETSDTTGGIWKYNFARSLPSENVYTSYGHDFETPVSSTNKAVYAIKQDTNCEIDCEIAPIEVIKQNNVLTLPANGWSDTAPYTQTVVTSQIFFTDNWEPIVGLNTNGITQEVYEQACDAQIVCTNCSLSVANSTFIFTAFGDKPTVNIPVSITVFFSP